MRSPPFMCARHLDVRFVHNQDRAQSERPVLNPCSVRSESRSRTEGMSGAIYRANPPLWQVRPASALAAACGQRRARACVRTCGRWRGRWRQRAVR